MSTPFLLCAERMEALASKAAVLSTVPMPQPVSLPLHFFPLCTCYLYLACIPAGFKRLLRLEAGLCVEAGMGLSAGDLKFRPVLVPWTALEHQAHLSWTLGTAGAPRTVGQSPKAGSDTAFLGVKGATLLFLWEVLGASDSSLGSHVPYSGAQRNRPAASILMPGAIAPCLRPMENAHASVAPTVEIWAGVSTLDWDPTCATVLP